MLAREIGAAGEPAAIGAAMHRALERVSTNLRRSVGDDGYVALVSRAITRTQAEHPLLLDIRRNGDENISRDGVVASVDAHGIPPVTAALESLLASIADLLSGLIGADMVTNLLDPDGLLPEASQRREAP